MCLSLCDYRYVTDGEDFGVMEHQKSILDTKHKKRVLLLIEVDNFKVIESVWGRE